MTKSTTDRIRLPDNHQNATLVGRVFRPELEGPAVVCVVNGRVYDITSSTTPTVSSLFETSDPVARVNASADYGEDLGSFDQLAGNSDEARRDKHKPWLLAPVDLQALKASGVTFVASLLERVIEEQARGAPDKAASIRADISALIGEDLSSLRPGSEQAMAVKQSLIEKGAWSQYLEVGIGPDAEIFTKAQPLSAVGAGAHIGILSRSSWNNPEPEVALVANSRGEIVGATLANDVNLRDFEGRSALLLGKAKDNNASCALGPLIRLFDQEYALNDVRQAEIGLEVEGIDGFRLVDGSSMRLISREPEDLVRATLNASHQYPDGLVLLLGTMFAPVQDRIAPGEGFTHKIDDLVTISNETLGALCNRVRYCNDCAPWRFGVSALLKNLASRGLL